METSAEQDGTRIKKKKKKLPNPQPVALELDARSRRRVADDRYRIEDGMVDRDAQGRGCGTAAEQDATLISGCR